MEVRMPIKKRVHRYLGKMTSKGQTTVPKEVRTYLGLEEGTQVEWTLDDGKATVKPKTVSLDDIYGMLWRPEEPSMTVEEMDEALGRALAEDDERIRAGR
jgi:AbrB family looped-hinge helix DNA binding protein